MGAFFSLSGITAVQGQRQAGELLRQESSPLIWNSSLIKGIWVWDLMIQGLEQSSRPAWILPPIHPEIFLRLICRRCIDYFISPAQPSNINSSLFPALLVANLSSVTWKGLDITHPSILANWFTTLWLQVLYFCQRLSLLLYKHMMFTFNLGSFFLITPL